MWLRGRQAVLFLLPAALVFGLFAVYPTIRGIVISFTDAQGISGGRYVGLANYRRMLHDATFSDALRNTLMFTAVIVVVQNVGGLAVAAWLRSQPRVRAVAQSSLLLPSMMAFVAVGYVWSFIYSPLGGPLNSMLRLLGLGSLQQVWLGDQRTALLAISASSIWMFLGYTAIIYLAGYLSIPGEVIEAAQIDGAGGWGRFRQVEWPLLAPAVTVSVTLSVIGTLRIFELPLVMTRGGPAGATETLSLFVYDTSFSSFEFGYGTAIATVLLLVTVLLAVVVTTVLRRREVAMG
ncbi:sugar ABC transporter permease [Kribbella sp. NPDC026611]|uniref:carbohydrate ABC transporter permease n=1 Tax=Kribbella sp. NPDC026611 TaxID=3154911 RepID=UPI0034114971